MMYRGTTPTLTFYLPLDPTTLTTCYITFTQDNEVVLEKTLNDCQMGTDNLSFKLSQKETLAFQSDSTVCIQVRCKINQMALASQIMYTNVCDILKEGEI